MVIYWKMVIYWNMVIYWKIVICWNTVIYWKMVICWNTVICGNMVICWNTVIFGNMVICWNMVICRNTIIWSLHFFFPDALYFSLAAFWKGVGMSEQPLPGMRSLLLGCYLPKATLETGSQLKGTVHHDEEVMAARAWSGWSYSMRSVQEAESSGCSSLAHFLLLTESCAHIYFASLHLS